MFEGDSSIDDKVWAELLKEADKNDDGEVGSSDRRSSS
jgi:Ca2+-binding EF-hand superfamily protein